MSREPLQTRAHRFSNNVLTSGLVRFVPALPAWKKRALASSPTLPFNKIFVKFAADQEPFWDPTEWVLFADSVPVACAKAPAPSSSPPRSPARRPRCTQPLQAQTQTQTDLMHETSDVANGQQRPVGNVFKGASNGPDAAPEEAPLQELVRIRKKSAALSSARTRGDRFTRGKTIFFLLVISA